MSELTSLQTTALASVLSYCETDAQRRATYQLTRTLDGLELLCYFARVTAPLLALTTKR